jgi:predicted short-subunit dehydrogenase-like oxidoreductase (DUF2520 family)
MKVVIIGSGNVATVLGRMMKKAGHIIVEVFSRQADHAELLANELQCGFTDKPHLIDQTAEVYLFALSDTALYSLGQTFQLRDKLALHTAGSVPIDVLQKVSSNYGVLYPLQSLRKEMESIPDIPLLIDANSEDNKANIESFAKTISPLVSISSYEQRLRLHVAAVFVNNFTNHLYTMASDYCTKENLDFSLLFPLITETAQRIHQYAPNNMQTGPAVRKETITIDRHLKLLSDYPALKYIYAKLTDSIIEYGRGNVI